MPLNKKPTKRTIGKAINRAVREVQGSRTGHQYLEQAQFDYNARMAGWNAIRRYKASDFEGNSGFPGGSGGGGGIGGDGPVELGGVFVIDISPIDGPNDLIV